MNINAVMAHALPIKNQSIRSDVLAGSNQSFSNLFNHIGDLAVQDEAFIDQSNQESVSEGLAQLSEQEIELLINLVESKFGIELEDSEQLSTELARLLKGDFEEERLDLQSLMDFLIDQSGKMPSIQYLTHYSSNSVQLNQIALLPQQSPQNEEALVGALNELIDRFDSFSQEDAKQLLDLLKSMQTSKQTLPETIDKLTSQHGERSNLDILEKVSDNIQKKLTLAQRATYQSDAPVTSRDILKWVRAAVEQIADQDKQQTRTFGQLFQQQQTASPIEQLHIELGHQMEATEQLSEQLISKFEQAIAQSSFLQGKNGANQLLVKLAPESLGSIMVELTEIDGEMLVKLTASSQATKEALEANVKELRHMFAPQNILIEKQETAPIFFEQPSLFEQQEEEHAFNEQEQHSESNDESDSKEDSIRFEDVLFQERV